MNRINEVFLHLGALFMGTMNHFREILKDADMHLRGIYRALFRIALVISLISSSAFANTRQIGQPYLVVYKVLDENNDHVTGQTVALSIRKVSNSYYYDFADSTFKASGWTNKTTNLSEDATNGFYYRSWTPPAAETTAEQYLFCVDNEDSTYNDEQCDLVGYQVAGSGASAADIADAVWDEAISGHLTVGSTGKKLNDVSAGANPWAIDPCDNAYNDLAGEMLCKMYRKRR